MNAEERIAKIAKEVWNRTGWGDGEPELAEGHLCRESVKAGYKAGLESQEEWVPTSKEWPAEGQSVLVSDGPNNVLVAHQMRGKEWFATTPTDDFRIAIPKFWKRIGPLPTLERED